MKLPVTLTPKEISVINEIRKIEYGVVEVHKVKGEIIRVKSIISHEVFDKDGMDALKENPNLTSEFVIDVIEAKASIEK